MLASVGKMLQEERIRQKRTLKEISDALNIRQNYLEAVEANQYAIIPGSVFAKGFIRNYGNYLGLDGAALVDEYKASVEEKTPRPEVRTVVLPKKKKERRVESKRKGRQGKWPEITIIAGVVIFLLLILWILL